MRLHCVMVLHSLVDEPKALVDATKDSVHDVTWWLFLHSQDDEVEKMAKTLGRRKDVNLMAYGENRGLARSWNEGILLAYEDENQSADVVIVTNDDMVARAEDFDMVAGLAIDNRNHYLIQGMMYDHQLERRMGSDFGFFAINPIAIEVIGMFDEQFVPVYFEDKDYARRGYLAGLHIKIAESTQMEHVGSATLDAVGVEVHTPLFEANQDYYKRKWGGLPGSETFERPFNDRRFSTDIAPCRRSRPYWGFERDDYAIE